MKQFIRKLEGFIPAIGKRYILYMHPNDVLNNRFPKWLAKYKDDFMIKETNLVKEGKGYILDPEVFKMKTPEFEDIIPPRKMSIIEKMKYGETS